VAIAGAALAVGMAGRAPDAAGPRRELRAVWVVRTDLASEERIREIVRTARAAGLNTLFVQVRGRGDAYYLSDLEPRAQALRGTPHDFDPLAVAVREGHRAGLAVHAWLNAMYVWSEATRPADAGHILNAHPDWLAVEANGRRHGLGTPGGAFLCPSNPDARAHLRAVYVDVARRYPVDGIQLDYIRYPNAHTCYCAGCRSRFTAWLEACGRAGLARRGSITATYPSEWRTWRSEQITSLVASIRDDLRAVRPELTLSAAVIPWGHYPQNFRLSDAYTTCGQDWDGWIRAGLVDAVAPMTYTPNTTVFRGWVQGMTRAHPGFPIWWGIGAYHCSPEAAAEKVRIVRSAQAPGWSLFSYGSVTSGCTNDAYLRTLVNQAGVRTATDGPAQIENAKSPRPRTIVGRGPQGETAKDFGTELRKSPAVAGTRDTERN
jgi:uncharacterized lipoprotein YddW (UPF0748 family)